MTKAEQMFKDLGYKSRVSINYITYRTVKNDAEYHYITFNKDMKRYVCLNDRYEENQPIFITTPLHLAIHEQLKELGWI